MKSNIYKPHIDGLRAIAVLAVIFYHAKLKFIDFSFFTGGYLGVDVFFVISGYLISKIIFFDLIVKSNFSFQRFFIRRIKRILPNLLFVILFFLIVSFFFLLPADLIFLAKQAISQIFLISNIFFWNYLEFSYSAEKSLYIPFLHTWSLSIEEQFYIFFPVFLFFLKKIIKNNYLLIFICIFTISLIISYYFSIFFKSFNFYIIFSRIWEFLLGSIFSYIEIKNKNFLKKIKYKEFISIISLTILLFSFFFFNDKTAHPSLLTLLPTFSTIFLILFLKKENFLYDVLSYKPLVNIGLISFSLYLWHYPIFSIYRKTFFSAIYNESYVYFFLIILTFILSILSYFFIEVRYRYFVSKISLVFKFVFFFIVSILICSILIIQNQGFPKRVNLTDLQLSVIKDEKNITDYKLKNSKNFNKKNILILGNSHGKELHEAITRSQILSDNINSNFHRIEMNCLNFFLLHNMDKCNTLVNLKDKNYSANLLKKIRSADFIFIKNRFSKNDLKIMEELLFRIKIINNNIVLFSNTPEILINNTNYKYYFYNKESFLKKNLFSKSLYYEKFVLEYDRQPNNDESKKISEEYYLNVNSKVSYINNELVRIINKTKVQYLNLNQFLCDEEKKTCYFKTKNNYKIFTDEAGHLAKEYWDELIRNNSFQTKLLSVLK